VPGLPGERASNILQFLTDAPDVAGADRDDPVMSAYAAARTD
jgi:hypothetical protein